MKPQALIGHQSPSGTATKGSREEEARPVEGDCVNSGFEFRVQIRKLNLGLVMSVHNGSRLRGDTCDPRVPTSPLTGGPLTEAHLTGVAHAGLACESANQDYPARKIPGALQNRQSPLIPSGGRGPTQGDSSAGLFITCVSKDQISHIRDLKKRNRAVGEGGVGTINQREPDKGLKHLSEFWAQI